MTAVWLSRGLGPEIGGIIAVFPAVFVSTLLIAYRARGLEFARSMARPLLLSGTINIIIYVVCIHILYPRSGILFGTLAAFFMSAISAYILFRISHRKS
jgi:hypothetical protein